MSKDPVHELEASRALLDDAKRRRERLPDSDPQASELDALIRGLQREVEWWGPRALAAVRGKS